MVETSAEGLEKEQLEGYIIRQFKKGFSKGQIKKALIDAEYPEGVAEKAIKVAELKRKEEAPSKGIKPESMFKISPKLLLISLSVLIVVIVIVWFGASILMKEKGPICGDKICEDEEASCPEDCIAAKEEKDKIKDELDLCKDDAKNSCLAIVNKDMNSCNSIKIEAMKDSCLTITMFISDIIEKKDTTSCSKMKEGERENCLIFIDAIKTGDKAKCKSETCKFAFDLYLAISQKNINLCEDIEEYSTKKDCKLYLTSNMDHCDYSYCDDVYNIHMREVTNDLSYCDKVINPSGKRTCLEYKKT